MKSVFFPSLIAVLLVVSIALQFCAFYWYMKLKKLSKLAELDGSLTGLKLNTDYYRQQQQLPMTLVVLTEFVISNRIHNNGRLMKTFPVHW